MQIVPIKTVRAQSFVEVTAFNRLYYLIPRKRSDIIITRVVTNIINGVYSHLFISIDIEVDLIWMLSPVVWSFINLGEVLGNFIIHLISVLKRLHVTVLILPLDLCHHRVISSDLEESISLLVKLFHLSIPHQLG